MLFRSFVTAVEVAEGGYGGGNEGLAIFGSGESLLDGAAEIRASALLNESFGLLCGGEVTEDDLGASLTEEADGGCADSAGSSGNQSDLTCEGHDDAGVRVGGHILDTIESIFLTQVAPALRVLHQIRLRS